MSVELPFAPVDAVIRRNARDLRVSADAAETLARRIQAHGASLAVEAAERADTDDRKTLMADDFDVADIDRDDVELPIAPIDRIARLEIDDHYRVSMDARVALASILEDYADDIATTTRILARHAGRRTIKSEDVEIYFDIEQHFE